ncbi:hypothetical protein C8039_02715 [Halogeometricum sp. wsp3]|nr:hypothetical protein C8039_02715 [Halogeometricum sp. wsp3]
MTDQARARVSEPYGDSEAEQSELKQDVGSNESEANCSTKEVSLAYGGVAGAATRKRSDEVCRVTAGASYSVGPKQSACVR